MWSPEAQKVKSTKLDQGWTPLLDGGAFFSMGQGGARAMIRGSRIFAILMIFLK